MTKETHLSDLNERPDDLLKYGFERHEENTTDPERWVWYRLPLDSSESNAGIELEVRFSLALHDDPYATEAENRDYVFEDVALRVSERIRDEESFFSDLTLDEDEDEAEARNFIDRFPLWIYTLEELLAMVRALGGEVEEAAESKFWKTPSGNFIEELPGGAGFKRADGSLVTGTDAAMLAGAILGNWETSVATKEEFEKAEFTSS